MNEDEKEQLLRDFQFFLDDMEAYENYILDIDEHSQEYKNILLAWLGKLVAATRDSMEEVIKK
jgi:hypothetical protein